MCNAYHAARKILLGKGTNDRQREIDQLRDERDSYRGRAYHAEELLQTARSNAIEDKAGVIACLKARLTLVQVLLFHCKTPGELLAANALQDEQHLREAIRFIEELAS